MYITEWVRKNEMIKTTKGIMTAKQWVFSECERIKNRTNRTPKVVKMRNEGGYVSYRVKDDSVKMARIEGVWAVVPATYIIPPRNMLWTTKELNMLKNLKLSNMSVAGIGRKLGRSYQSCYYQLKIMDDNDTRNN